MELAKGTKFILHSENGTDYKGEIINVNDYREPSMKYVIEFDTGAEDIYFCGDDWFEENKDRIKFIEKGE